MSDIGRILVFAGIALVLVGGVILLLNRFPGLPFGRLPADFSWERGGTRVYLPLATMLLVSIVLTILVNLNSKL
jgi:hypothetical protein